MSKFHVGPSDKSQLVDGVVGLLLPSLEDLERRLEGITKRMEGTLFRWVVQGM
jgi:hypothetical protein